MNQALIRIYIEKIAALTGGNKCMKPFRAGNLDTAYHLVERYTVRVKIDEGKYGKVQALWK